MKRNVLLVPLLLMTGIVLATDVPEDERVAGPTEVPAQAETGAEEVPVAAETQTQTKEGPKVISGMSVLGNREAPKSLVIAPWKSSELGDSIGIATMLDDSRSPIDQEVFMRELSYYEIRSKTTP